VDLKPFKTIEIKLIFILFSLISFIIGLSNGIPTNQIIRYFSILILIYTYPLNFTLTKNYHKIFFFIGFYLISALPNEILSSDCH
jgi:hypothetical protein